jgi:peroxiredoxin
MAPVARLAAAFVFLLCACPGVPRPATDAAVTDAAVADAAVTDADIDDAAVEPATWGQPLVPLAAVSVGDAEIIEVSAADDGRFVACGAREGLVVVDARDPAAPVVAPRAQTELDGASYFRCTHVTLGGTTAYVTFRADSTGPSFLAAFELGATAVISAAYAAPAERVLASSVVRGDAVITAMLREGLGVFTREGRALVQRGALGGLTDAQGLDLVGATLYVADGAGGLAVVDASDPLAMRVVGRVSTGGVAQIVAVDAARSMAYVSGSTGVVIVDVSRPAAPAVAGRIAQAAPVGQLAVADGRLYVAASRDLRVYSLDDPRRPRRVAVARPTNPGTFTRVRGVAVRGDVVALADWGRFETYRARRGFAAPYLDVPDEPLSFGRVAAGAARRAFVTVENLGLAPAARVVAAVDGPAFAVSPAEFSLGVGESRELQIDLSAPDETPRLGALRLATGGVEPATASLALSANARGVEPGDVAPDESASLTDGRAWRSADERGHPLLMVYFSTWCPVCGFELPYLEANVWARFRARGLAVVGVAPPVGPRPDNLDDVRAFARHGGFTFPMGPSPTNTYAEMIQGRGDNNTPFPLLALVDRAGRLTYLAVTLDPPGLTRAIEDALR